MAAEFPTTLPSIARVSPTDYMNDPGKEADVLHNKLADEVEALAAVVGVTGSAVPATIQARLSNVVGLLQTQISITPLTIGWDFDKYPIEPTFAVGIGGRCKGSAGITPEALFDLFSVARTAPTNTYYVDKATGSDANAGTALAKFNTIKKSIEVGNASGAPFKVYVTAGVYDRASTFAGTGGMAPTQDCAFIAVGGTVECGSWDSYTAPSLHGTYTNCYAITTTNVMRCLDLTRKDEEGLFFELQNVATAALCNDRPGSWTSESGTIYVNRADGLAVTYANTRLLRRAVIMSLSNASQVSVYVGSDTGGSWEMQGSDSVATLRQVVSTPSASDKAVVMKNCAFRYAGGFNDAASRCVQIDSYPGIVALFECDASRSVTDGFNVKNESGVVAPMFLTVNCTGVHFGSTGAGTSCNAWTLHDDAIGIDICGNYKISSGGTVHNIGTSKAALIGSTIGYDRGDLYHGGSIAPTAVRAADTALIDMYACTITQNDGLALHADGASSIVHDAAPGTMRTAGNVTNRA